MRRRHFITVIGGAACAAMSPRVARAQRHPMPVVGFLNHGSPEGQVAFLRAFRDGLSETGYREGQNMMIEYRWAQNQVARLPELAADLVARRVAAIATPVSTPASLAAKAATPTIPIVFGIGTDPVQEGLVASFNRPGANVTGVSGMSWELGAKRLGLLHQLLPAAARFGVLVNPSNIPDVVERFVKDVQAAAAVIGRQIEVISASSNRDIDAVFMDLAQKRVDGLMVTPDNLFNNRRVQLVTLITRQGMPAIYPWREAVEIGGLMSYATSFAELFREVGIYCGRILNGEKPADLPVMQASKFEFVINVQTARALGIAVPPTLIALADEVIE